jgi:predicted nucleotidyltransferase
MALFGSSARGDAYPGSDVDLLVEFNRSGGIVWAGFIAASFVITARLPWILTLLTA